MTDPQLSFDLPDSNSEQVQQEKNNLEGANTIKQLAKELKKVDIAVCLASNAACASEDSSLWIKTRNVLKQLEAIYGNCAITAADFSAATQSVMDNFEIAFQMLQETQEEIAIEILKESSTIAQKCQQKAQKLAQDIRKDIEKVDDLIKDTSKKTVATAKSQEKREKKLEKAQQNFNVRQQQFQAELRDYEDAIEKLTKDYQTAKRDLDDKQNKRAKQWFEGVTESDVNGALTKCEKIHKELEKAQENKQQRQHDLNELRRQNKQDNIDIDEDEIDFTIKCLEQVSKGLAQMVQTLGKSASFWELASQKSGNLENSDLQGNIVEFIGRVDKDWWKNWWQQNPTMKKIATEYYAKWLALHDVCQELCQEFENQVHMAQMDAWNLLGEAPTREEGRKKIEEIANQIDNYGTHQNEQLIALLCIKLWKQNS